LASAGTAPAAEPTPKALGDRVVELVAMVGVFQAGLKPACS
jgi:hypothetical protein